MGWLFAFIGFLTVGVFMMPIDLLPHTRAATARALFGTMLLIVAGVFLGQLFVCLQCLT